MSQYKHFDVELVEDVTVLQLKDAKLTETLIVNELEDEMLDLIERERPDHLLVDFQGVAHCSTAVINGLLRAKKRLVASGGQLRLCGMSRSVREAYKILNLDGTVFQINDDRNGALAAF